MFYNPKAHYSYCQRTAWPNRTSQLRTVACFKTTDFASSKRRGNCWNFVPTFCRKFEGLSMHDLFSNQRVFNCVGLFYFYEVQSTSN